MGINLLIKLDSDSIHDYIFLTSKLKQIQAASELIDDLIFNQLPSEMEKMLDWDDNGNQCRKEMIIQGGGNLLVEYRLSAAVSEEIITKVMDDLLLRLCYHYEQVTGGATISGDWIKYEREEYFSDALAQLEQKIALKKGIPHLPLVIPGGFYLKRCESCRKGTCDASAPIQDSFNGVNLYLCPSCANKENYNRKNMDGKGFPVARDPAKSQSDKGSLRREKRWPVCWAVFGVGQWKKMGEEYYRLRPNSFEDLVEGEKEGEKWLGLIYLDGNSMGETIFNIRQKEELQRFSDKVDEAMNCSVVETLSSLFPYPKDDEIAPFNVLILGGDDLVMLIKPKKACLAAVQIIKKFEKYTQQSGFPLTASAGIVFFHYKYPISRAIQAGKDLLKNAKRHACEDSIRKEVGGKNLPGSTIDFTVLNDPGSEDPEGYRKKQRKRVPSYSQITERPYLFCRPYEISAFKELLERIEDLKRGDDRLSTSRLNSLRQAIFAGRSKAILASLHAIAHGTSTDLQRKLKEILRYGGGRKPAGVFEPPYVTGKLEDQGETIRRTVVLDIADFYDFVEENTEIGIFISCIKEEEELALKLKEILCNDFLGWAVPFVSSGEIEPGTDRWLEEIVERLRKTDILLFMCSPKSVKDPGRYFEFGAALLQDKSVIPICYGGLKISDLPSEFNRDKAVSLKDPDHIMNLYKVVAEKLPSFIRTPAIDYQSRSQELSAIVPAEKILFLVSTNLMDGYRQSLNRISPRLELEFVDFAEIDSKMEGDTYKYKYEKIVYHHPHPESTDPCYVQLIERLKNDQVSLPLITFSDSDCADFQVGCSYSGTVFVNMITTLMQRIND